MVKETGVPAQDTPLLVNVGVTVIVAVTGTELVFDAVNEGMLSFPEAGRPMEGRLLVQE